MPLAKSDFIYQGDELALFAQASTWQGYLRTLTAAYIRGAVLEIGAGHGSMTKALFDAKRVDRWLCLDPDARRIDIIEKAIAGGELPPVCQTRHGYANDLAPEEKFDAILYLDVLEHIDDDRGEMATAVRHLKQNGHLIVLSPAFEFLRSARDDVLGHVRRYTATNLKAVMPDGVEQIVCRYVDCFGALAVLSNRVLLRQKEAGMGQLKFWDQKLIPLSRLFDPLFQRYFGRSVLWVGRAKKTI